MATLRRFIRNLTRPAPLEEFPDYDAYWQLRHEQDGRQVFRYRYEYVAGIIPPGASVLDLGCGDGALLRELRERNPTGRIVGADVSDGVVQALKRDGFDVRLLATSGTLEEQFGERFDYVVMMEVVEHVVDCEEITRQAAKVARSRLIITTPNVGFLTHRLRLGLFGRFPITSVCHHMKEHVRFWTVTDFKEWAGSLGLRICRITPQVSPAESRIASFLGRVWPNMFAKQVIYEIDTNSRART